MAEVLTLTNDLDSVNLLDPTTINLIEWEPSLPVFKEATTSSMYQDGTTLVNRLFDNVTETMKLYVVGQDDNDAINNLRVLISILERGIAFYTGVVATPTYLSVKGLNETNPRYAIVKKWRIDKIPHYLQDSQFRAGAVSAGVPYNAVFVEINLVMDLSLYRDVAPGSYEDSLAMGKNEFNGRTYGTVDSSEADDPQEAVYIATQYSQSNLTHIYRFDASSATFSSNLIDAALPYDLFPNPIGVNDIIYFGVQSSISGAYQPPNLVLDLIPASDQIVGAWQYRSGGFWVDFPYDESEGFSLAGVRGIFNYSANAETIAINGVTAYWLRFIITNTNGVTTPPKQQNRRPYSATWPYVEIPDTQVTGDVTSLLSLRSLHLGYNVDKVSRFLGGLRDTSRGSGFSAYINFSDVNNVSGITLSSLDDALATVSFFDGTRAVLVNRPAPPDSNYFSMSINFDNPSSFSGKFRVILSVEINTSLAEVDASFFISLYPSALATPFFTSEVKTLSTSGGHRIVDFGEIDFSPGLKRGQALSYLRAILNYKVTSSSACQLYLVRLLLIPCDEWSFDWISPGWGVQVGQEIVVDPSIPPEHIVQVLDDGAFFSSMVPIMVTPPMLSSNTTQRLWIAAMESESTGKYAITQATFKITPNIFSRYLIPRGSS